jgi:hypothetical protein
MRRKGTPRQEVIIVGVYLHFAARFSYGLGNRPCVVPFSTHSVDASNGMNLTCEGALQTQVSLNEYTQSLFESSRRRCSAFAVLAVTTASCET